MVEVLDKHGGKPPAIIDRLTRGEFRKAWDGIIGLARRALAKKEALDPRLKTGITCTAESMNVYMTKEVMKLEID